MPGEETVTGGEARDGEDLHRLVGEEWRQRCGGDSRIAQGQRGKLNGLTLVIAQRARRADQPRTRCPRARLSLTKATCRVSFRAAIQQP